MRLGRRTAGLVAGIVCAVAVVGGADASAAESAGDRLQVKFLEGSDVRVSDGRFVDAEGRDVAPELAGYQGVSLSRVFSRSDSDLRAEHERFERRSGKHLADLSAWFAVQIAPGQAVDELRERLEALPEVESVAPAPIAARPPVAPSFLSQQGYLARPPAGIGAASVSSVPGSRGSEVRIIDVEYSWSRVHEDLTRAAPDASLIANGTPVDPFTNINHGTAVLGEVSADDNDFGVTGIVSDASLRLVNAANSERGYDIANAINVAQAAARPGDVILVEQQAFGRLGAFVPTEAIPSAYDAIRTATAAGVIVVEAAGNGAANLDDPIYGSTFPDGKPDSGAIVVGAGAAPCNPNQPARTRLPFSDYGRRVNLQGWGECVVTTGFGDLWGGDPAVDGYTAHFTGTSSASAIVAAAAAAFSSAYELANDVAPSPARVRQTLISSATAEHPHSDGHIGPLPDLKAALSRKSLRP